jgi:tetratricopeptide (TPR) repeat protein
VKSGDNATGACTAYKDAATMYKKSGDIKRAIAFNTLLAQMYEEKNRTSQAAKVYQELSELHLECKSLEDAILASENVIRCYEILDQPMHSIDAKAKLADLCSDLERYQRAIDLYEEAAEPKGGRTNHNAAGWYWRAMICRMVLEVSATNDVKQCASELQRYQNLYPGFSTGVNRRNFVLLQKIIDSFANESVAEFEKALEDHERSAGTLNPWEISHLLKVKNSLTNPSVVTSKALTGIAAPDPDDEFT